MNKNNILKLISKIKTYKDLLELNESVEKFSKWTQTTYKFFKCKNSEELFIKLHKENNEQFRNTCTYCSCEVEFKNLYMGYKTICNSKECISKLLSDTVSKNHSEKTQDQKEEWKEAIKRNQKSHKEENFTKEYFIDLYPELKEKFTPEEFLKFYNNNPTNTVHLLRIYKLFFNTDNLHEIYNLFFQKEYCFCGKEKVFMNFNNPYKETCGSIILSYKDV